jgi:hypothetical protein
MSRNGSYAKSMNGIVSFDDGDGTVIEGDGITTGIINCITLNASSTVNSSTLNVDFIGENANAYISVLSNTKFNGNVYTDNINANSSSSITLNNNTLITGSLTANTLKTESIDGKDTNSISKQLKIGYSNANTTSVNIGRAELNILGTIYPAIPPRTTFYAVGNDDIANKFYVDSVTAGTNILSLSNTFTGTTNTFNNIIQAATIQQLPSLANANIFNKINSSSSINIASDSTNTYGGPIYIACGTGVQSASVDILTNPNTSNLYLQALNLCSGTGIITLCSSIKIGLDQIFASSNASTKDIFKNTTGKIILGGSGQIALGSNLLIQTNTITANTLTDTQEIFKTTTGDITLGSTGKINIGDSISVTSKTIGTTASTDTISLFNTITTGAINTCTNLVLSNNNYNCSGINDIVRILEKITTGTIYLANGLSTGFLYLCSGSFVFKVNSIASGAVSSITNLFTNITTGTVNFATGITTGTINIGTTGMTSGSVNIGTTGMTGATKINGRLQFGTSQIAGYTSYVSTSANYNVPTTINNEFFVYCTGSTAHSIYLPAYITGQKIYIRNAIGAGQISNVTAQTGQNIIFPAGGLGQTYTMPNNSGLMLYCDGSAWIVMLKY